MSSGSPQDGVPLAERLGALVGEERVNLEPGVAIHGRFAPLEVCPADEDQMGAVLALANCENLGVCIAGGGTKLDWGNRPNRFDLLVSTRHLRGCSEVDADNLSLTAFAGTPVCEVRAQADAVQRVLPLDARRSCTATVGGVAATGDQGARGARYGGVRDVVLGIRAILGDGSRVRFGGRTMKNVTGYDLTKLFIGSFGTLGVITEVTFRLLPRPDKQALIAIPLRSLEEGVEVVAWILDSYLEPFALEVLSPAYAASVLAADEWFLLAGFSGHRAAVTRSIADVRDRFAVANAAVLEDDEAGSALEALADADSVSTEVGSCLAVRVTVPTSEVWALAEAGALGASDIGLALDYRLSAARGALELQVDTSAAQASPVAQSSPSGVTADLLATFVSTLRDRAMAVGGHLVVIRGLTMLPPEFDAWGDPGPSLKLMKRIKDRFDPHGVLNTGRFVGGM